MLNSTNVALSSYFLSICFLTLLLLLFYSVFRITGFCCSENLVHQLAWPGKIKMKIKTKIEIQMAAES